MGINKAKAAGIRFGPKPLLTLPSDREGENPAGRRCNSPGDHAAAPSSARPVSIAHLGVKPLQRGSEGRAYWSWQIPRPSSEGRKGYLSPVTAPEWAAVPQHGGVEHDNAVTLLDASLAISTCMLLGRE